MSWYATANDLAVQHTSDTQRNDDTQVIVYSAHPSELRIARRDIEAPPCDTDSKLSTKNGTVPLACPWRAIASRTYRQGGFRITRISSIDDDLCLLPAVDSDAGRAR